MAISLTLASDAMASLAREPRKAVEGTFAYGGQTLARVAVKFKGHRSLRKWSSKPAFKLDFDEHERGRTMLGLRGLVLDNMVDDPTMVREQLGYLVFRTLGVPAPRTGYAELRVNGERFGLYSLLEPIDRPFLARAFGDGDGALYEGEYGCDVSPEQVLQLGLEEGQDEGRAHVRALAASAAGPIARAFDADGALDGQRFFAFLAASAWLADFDGYRHAHNYRLYFEPKRERWSVLPWGLDRVLDHEMSVFDSHELLASKCFADAACRLRYVKALYEAIPRIDALDLRGRFERIVARIAKAVARDERRPYDDRARGAKLDATRAWLEARSARVREQIACWDGHAERDGDHDGYACLDCDDGDPGVHPGATEACNGRDDDCSGVADDVAACPCPEQIIAGARFAFCDRAVSWTRAAAICTGQGGALAFLESRDQARALGRAALAVRNVDWWIGLNDREHEGQRNWQGGAKSVLRDWATGEPDDFACAENCVAIKEDSDGRWHDTSCETPQPFVCRLP